MLRGDFIMFQNNKLINILLYGACLFSCLSQLPLFISGGMTQAVSFPLWIIGFLILFVNSGWKMDRSIMKLAMPSGVFAFIVLLASLFNGGGSYTSSSLFYSFLISMFIFLIGNMGGKYVTDEVLGNIYLFYIIGTVIVSVSVFVQYFGFGYDMSSRVYAYQSKNSFAQIIFTAVILLMIRFKPQKRIRTIIKWGLVAFEILLMVYLRSRATLVSFLVAVVILVLSKNTRRSLKALITIVCIALIVMMLTNESLNEAIFNNILFAGRDSSNLDDLTSGRITILQNFPELISGNWLFGIGSDYFECFYLSAILQFGFLAGAVLIYISFVPAYYGVSLARTSENWYILMVIAIGYLVDGIFEGLTPFGAGIKCYFMWFLFGLLIARRNYVEGNGQTDNDNKNFGTLTLEKRTEECQNKHQ